MKMGSKVSVYVRDSVETRGSQRRRGEEELTSSNLRGSHGAGRTIPRTTDSSGTKNHDLL